MGTSAVTMFDEGFLSDNAALEKINSVAFDEGLRAPGRAALEALDALMPSVESVDDLSVEDRGDRYIVSLSAPYVEPEDLEVEVEDGFLTVSGTTHHELWTGGRESAHFERSLRLPADADAEVYGLSHVGEDLTIELQKSRQSRRQSRQVARLRPLPTSHRRRRSSRSRALASRGGSRRRVTCRRMVRVREHSEWCD